MSIPEPIISFATENAILLQFAEPALNGVDRSLQTRLCSLAQALRENPATDALLQDIVPGPGSLLLSLYDGRKARRLLRYAETLWLREDAARTPPRIHRIPVNYSPQFAPDLSALSAHTGLSALEIVQLHSQTQYLVECLGFMAGFAYLGGLDAALHIPRKHTPAARIPAGSVAIGGVHTAIYPSSTPGGWHIIGRTSVKMFQPDSYQPCLLQPGDQVQFVVTLDDPDEIRLPQKSVTGGTDHD
jgi:5-oxoprolinase (ATP-hydrolysing) subunit B